MTDMRMFYHWIKQWFVRPTCSYCTLTDEPQYGNICEICDEHEQEGATQ